MLNDEWVKSAPQKNRLKLQFWSCVPTTLTDVVYTHSLCACISSVFVVVLFCLSRATIVHTLHPHKKYGAQFVPQTDARATTWEQLYADAEMSRHILCARTQTFYISFDFGGTRVWNRNNNNRSATGNILEIRRPLLRKTCPRHAQRVRHRAQLVNYIIVECWICMRAVQYRTVVSKPKECYSVTQYFVHYEPLVESFRDRSQLCLAFSRGTGNVNLQFLWFY